MIVQQANNTALAELRYAAPGRLLICEPKCAWLAPLELELESHRPSGQGGDIIVAISTELFLGYREPRGRFGSVLGITDGLHFDFSPLAVFSGDDVNPHQGRFDLRDR